MRSKFFWLAALGVAVLAVIISHTSSGSNSQANANITPVPILPNIYENEEDYPYADYAWDEYEEPTPVDPGELEMQTETTLVAGRYAGFLAWGYFHHSAVAEPVAFAESSVIDTASGAVISFEEIINIEYIDKALSLLAEAIEAQSPEAAPYLHLIDSNWLTHTVIDHEGIRVLLPPDIAPWEMGFMSALISYEELDEAFLLWVELGLREPPRLPMVALTFDDGPSMYTDMILDILEEFGGRATFCVLGYRVANRPDTLRRTVALGSEVIGHSWDHRDFTRLNANAVADQITRTSAAIEEIIGFPPPPIYRAPFGITNTRVINTSRDLGYSLLHWSVDPQDWANRDAGWIYEHIMERVTDGAIVLLHDIHTSTAEAMLMVIPRLIEEGFQLVTASELIAYHFGELEPGEVYIGFRNRPLEQ